MKILRRAALAFSLYAVFLIVSLFSPSVLAADLPRPAGPVILTVTGAISITNAPGKAEFDQAMLEALGVEPQQVVLGESEAADGRFGF